MAVLLGSYSIALFGTSFVIATLTYITYRLLSDYLQKWFTMKPIPELEGTYPIIGNALIFKNNPGGKTKINILLQEAAYDTKDLTEKVSVYLMLYNYCKCVIIYIFFRFLWSNSGFCS